MRTVSGVVAPLVVRAAPVAGAVAGALVECFGSPACIAAVGGAAAIAIIAKEAGYNFSTDPATGAPVVSKPDPEACALGQTCEQYLFGAGGVSGSWGSFVYACKSGVAAAAAAYPNDIKAFYGTSYAGGTGCFFTKPGGAVDVMGQTGYRTIQGTGASDIPSSVNEMATAMGTKTNWANDSKVADLWDKVAKGIANGIPLQTPTVTGPTSIPSSPTVTTKPDGSTTTTTRRTDFGYVGPQVTAREVTTVSETLANGSTTSTTTTTAPATADACTTNSNGVGCDTNSLDTPALDIPTTSKAISFTAETWFGGGTCPADRVMVSHVTGQSIKVWDYQQTCNTITTYFRPILLICATLGALMLLTPKGQA